MVEGTWDGDFQPGGFQRAITSSAAGFAW